MCHTPAKWQQNRRNHMARINWKPAKLEPITIRFSYDVDYALKVWTGFVREDKTRAPGRPWTDAAISRMQFEASFAAHYQQSRNARVAFIKSAEDFGLTLKEVIRSPMWKWDRVTIRKSGEVAGMVRNIFDEGDLYDSQRMEEV